MASKDECSSRERILTAMRHQEPDRVPLWNLWRRQDTAFSYDDEIGRVEAVLEMGLDDTVLLKPPGPREEQLVQPAWIHPAEGRAYVTPPGGETDYPVLTKEYRTPEGPLRQSVKLTDDWPFGEDIPMLSDFNVSRSVRMLVNGRDDLSKARYLLKDPTRDQIAEFRSTAGKLRDFSHDRGVLLEGGWICLADMAVWIYGMERLIEAAIDDPGFVRELLQFVFEWERPRLELLLEEKVDVLVHSAWYEMPRFWSPRLYREFIKPLLAEEVKLAHGAGVPFTYILTAGSSMIMDDLLEIGVDAIRGVDPIQGDDDLALIEQKAGDKITIWGGMNSAITLGRGTPEEIRDAVDHAIRTCAPGGGFVLHPVDQIFSDTPMENVRIMIDRWKEVGRYPISL